MTQDKGIRLEDVLKQLNFLGKRKSSKASINKPDYDINRGFEFILTGGKPKTKPVHITTLKIGGRDMLAISLVFGSFLTLLFLIVGAIGGWVAREYMMNYQEIPRIHPEMFDGNGNLVPDDIVAFRFENYDNDKEEDDD
tara:strand:- start:1054 stop:1470 length:417 start_codon:yes stop_codon:yes gene_type:complete